jgi:hypothetical protein
MPRGRASGRSSKLSRSERLAYDSICEVRWQVDLGCRGCVLAGTVACPSSGGVGAPAPKLEIRERRGVFGGRPVDEYKCHVDLNSLLN